GGEGYSDNDDGSVQFIAGVVCESVSMIATDEQGRASFVKASGPMVYKKITVKAFSIYWNDMSSGPPHHSYGEGRSGSHSYLFQHPWNRSDDDFIAIMARPFKSHEHSR